MLMYLDDDDMMLIKLSYVVHDMTLISKLMRNNMLKWIFSVNNIDINFQFYLFSRSHWSVYVDYVSMCAIKLRF